MIAERTGYDSAASLSKAFKRAFVRSPGEYRRESRTRPTRIAEPAPMSNRGGDTASAGSGRVVLTTAMLAKVGRPCW